MTVTSKVLEKSNQEQLLQLVNARLMTFNNGFQDNEFKINWPKIVNGWFDSPLCYMVGMFDNEELLGSMIALESAHSPSWSWVYWISSTDNIYETFIQGDGLESLRQADKLIFDEMEINRGLNRFFVHNGYKSKDFGIKTTGMNSRLLAIMKRYNFRVSNYHLITDCIIPAGEMAKYSYQRELHGNRTWPMDTEIKMAVLIK